MAYRDYMRELELKLQQLDDLEDEALLARFRSTCPEAEELDIHHLIRTARDLFLKDGKSPSDARIQALKLLNTLLDSGSFAPNLDIIE